MAQATLIFTNVQLWKSFDTSAPDKRSVQTPNSKTLNSPLFFENQPHSLIIIIVKTRIQTYSKFYFIFHCCSCSQEMARARWRKTNSQNFWMKATLFNSIIVVMQSGIQSYSQEMARARWRQKTTCTAWTSVVRTSFYIYIVLYYMYYIYSLFRETYRSSQPTNQPVNY